MKKLYENLQLKACSKADISDAKSIFTGWLDSDFKNWNLKDECDANPMEMAVLEMDKDATFKEIFTDPEKMIVTQGQILSFVQNHKDKLRTDGYATFFLFKAGNEFFVVDVYFRDDGLLEVNVDRFSHGLVWDAGYRHRIVVPQLALSDLEPSSSDTLTLAIKMVKEAGYNIFKEI